LRLLSETFSCHEKVVEGEVMKIFKTLILGLSLDSRNEMAQALSNLSYTKSCREKLIADGACELLIALSITSSEQTQAQCGLALSYLSEITKVKSGVVASMLILSLKMENREVAEDELNKEVSTSTLPIVNTMSTINNISSTHMSLRASMANITNNNNNSNTSVSSMSSIINNINSTSVSTVHHKKASFLSTSIADSKKHMSSISINNINNNNASISINNNGDNENNANMLSDKNDTKNTTMKSKMLSLSQQTNLWQMIHDTIGDRAKFTSFIDKLKVSSTDNLFSNEFVAKNQLVSATSRDNSSNDLVNMNPHDTDVGKFKVHDIHAHIILSEENSVLVCNFDNYRYVLTSDSGNSTNFFEPEAAGMSLKMLVDLPLPSINVNRDLELILNRNDELFKIPINQHPLPKNLRKPVYMENSKSHGDLHSSFSSGVDINNTNHVAVSDNGSVSSRSGSPLRTTTKTNQHSKLVRQTSKQDMFSPLLHSTQQQQQQQQGVVGSNGLLSIRRFSLQQQELNLSTLHNNNNNNNNSNNNNVNNKNISPMATNNKKNNSINNTMMMNNNINNRSNSNNKSKISRNNSLSEL